MIIKLGGEDVRVCISMVIARLACRDRPVVGGRLIGTIVKRRPDKKIDLAVVESSTLCQNGSNGSTNAKFRQDCHAIRWFGKRIDAVIVIEAWRLNNNETGPHSNLGDLPLC